MPAWSMRIRFEDQMWGELGEKLGVNPAKVNAAQYATVPPEAAGLPGHSHIALIVGSGDIVRGGPGDDGSEQGIADLLRLQQSCCARWAAIPPFAAWWCASILPAATPLPRMRYGAR